MLHATSEQAVVWFDNQTAVDAESPAQEGLLDGAIAAGGESSSFDRERSYAIALGRLLVCLFQRGDHMLSNTTITKEDEICRRLNEYLTAPVYALSAGVDMSSTAVLASPI